MSHTSIRQQRSLLTALLTLAIALSACAPRAAAPSDTPVPSSTPQPSDTPAPSPTPLPSATPVPTATATPDVTATHVAWVTAETQKQIRRIAPELEELGFKTDSGSLVWVAGQPIKMSVTAFLEEKREQITQKAVADFILSTDVRWNSTSGLAGCSLVFRSEDDLEKGAQYFFPIMRLQNAPAWDIEYIKYGDWQKTINQGGAQFAPAIKDRQDDVNRLTLVVQGDQIKPYINGDPLMTATDSTLTSGQIAFETWQESGKTTCTFTNGWLWELKP